jgi:hypothetical protein
MSKVSRSFEKSQLNCSYMIKNTTVRMGKPVQRASGEMVSAEAGVEVTKQHTHLTTELDSQYSRHVVVTYFTGLVSSNIKRSELRFYSTAGRSS